jgi:hypothetical protein
MHHLSSNNKLPSESDPQVKLRHVLPMEPIPASGSMLPEPFGVIHTSTSVYPEATPAIGLTP